MRDPGSKSTRPFPCIKVKQPVGDFYIASLDKKTLCEITDFDVRRVIEERGFETYLGIQRPLNQKRVDEIANYINTFDACFPTGIILAVPGVCVKFDKDKNLMTLSNYIEGNNDEECVIYRYIARVLDGQHRIEGLKESGIENFDINVSIFVDIDIAEQAYIFSTVNLAQTKVNKSLVYDLFALAETRSPQKTCHNIAVALDQKKGSPFYKKIKRLGVATEGRFDETITQATFVQSLICYICKNYKEQISDRDFYMRRKKPHKANADEIETLIFRNMFIDEQDIEIADIIFNYFDAVKERWPRAWLNTGRGIMLNKTNGFKGLMRFLKNAYLHLTAPGEVPTKDQFLNILKKIDLQDEDFNTENFKPGSSGESELYRTLLNKSNLA